MLTNSLHSKDIAHQIHPATNMRRHERMGPIVIDRGSGIYVYDDEGREYIEGLAGLWSVGVGFGEKRLVEAATRQMAKLPYYHIFAHKTHEPSTRWPRSSSRWRPPDCSTSSSPIPAAKPTTPSIKFVWYYNNALGRTEKKKFIARQSAYHGITIAAGSLTGLPANQRGFDLPLPFAKHVTCPHYYRFGLPGESEAAFAERLATELEELILAEGPDTVAAFIGEPLMGAGGVIVPPADYWQRIQEVCRKYDVLVDRRRGHQRLRPARHHVRLRHFGIKPDILVCSKQITSSYQPLAAVLISDTIYQAMADQSDRLGTFGHGYTASAHPVATAVALENLAIIEERGLVGACGRGRRLYAGDAARALPITRWSARCAASA